MLALLAVAAVGAVAFVWSRRGGQTSNSSSSSSSGAAPLAAPRDHLDEEWALRLSQAAPLPAANAFGGMATNPRSTARFDLNDAKGVRDPRDVATLTHEELIRNENELIHGVQQVSNKGGFDPLMRVRKLVEESQATLDNRFFRAQMW